MALCINLLGHDIDNLIVVCIVQINLHLMQLYLKYLSMYFIALVYLYITYIGIRNVLHKAYKCLQLIYLSKHNNKWLICNSNKMYLQFTFVLPVFRNYNNFSLNDWQQDKNYRLMRLRTAYRLTSQKLKYLHSVGPQQSFQLNRWILQKILYKRGLSYFWGIILS